VKSWKFPAGRRDFSSSLRNALRSFQSLQEVNRADVSIPQPVIAEIAYGIECLPGSKRRELLQNRFDAIRLELARVPWTDPVRERFGTIKAALEKRGKRVADFDAAIAAHALAEGAVLVTANLEQMTRIPGLKVEDWSRQARRR
jgi:tRNA(fMet)-specific endonuclease VapC